MLLAGVLPYGLPATVPEYRFKSVHFYASFFLSTPFTEPFKSGIYHIIWDVETAEPASPTAAKAMADAAPAGATG
jgi:hypothetical protein